MTHVDVLKSMPADLRAALQVRSDKAGLLHLAGHMGVLVVTSIWILQGWPLWHIVLWVQGVVMVFLFTLQHECTHDTPFASPRLNRIVGHAVGLVIIQPFQWFRLFHMAHHRHTNDPDHDPELQNGAKPDGWRAYLWHVSGVPLWIGSARLVITNAVAPNPAPYLPAKSMPRLKREARWMLAAYGLAGLSLIWTTALLWVWIVPMVLGQPMLRLYLLAEHGRCPPVANMLENTRTTYTTRLIRWLAWNMPYHIEHHSAPNVPFHNLPELHNHMAPHLIRTSQGYHAFTKDYVADFTSG